MIPHRSLFCLTLFLVLLLTSTAGASPSISPAPKMAISPALSWQPASPLWADGWSINNLFSGLNNRTRIIQFCIVMMALGLFILMWKK